MVMITMVVVREHDAPPEDAEFWPAGQSEHAITEEAEYLPPGQAGHVDPVVAE